MFSQFIGEILRTEAQSYDNNHNITVPIIAFTSGKGGCGKTTLAGNFANIVSKSGQNVLLIDMDVSNRGTTGMFSRWTTTTHEMITCTRLIKDNLRYQDSMRKLLKVKDGYFLIPASSPAELPYEEPEGISLNNLINSLRGRIFEIAQFYNISCVIIDCFCGIDLLTTAASGISDDIIIVNEPDIITFTGSTNLFFHLTRAFKSLERKPKFHFVINRLRSTQSVVGLSKLYKDNIEDAVNEAILCYFPYNSTIFQNFGKYPFLSDLIPRSLFVKKLKLLAYFLFKGRFDNLLPPKVSGWSNRRLRSIYKKSLDPTAIDAQHLVIKLTSFPVLIVIWAITSLLVFNTIAPSPFVGWILIMILVFVAATICLTTLVHGTWRAGRVNFNVGLFRFRLAFILKSEALMRQRKFASSFFPMFSGLLISSFGAILFVFVISFFLFFMDFALNRDLLDYHGNDSSDNRQLKMSSYPFSKLDLKNMTITEYDFPYFGSYKYILSNTIFKRCKFNNPDFTYVSINNCNFQDCDFKRPYSFEYDYIYKLYYSPSDSSLNDAQHDYFKMTNQLRKEYRTIDNAVWESVNLTDSRYFQTIAFRQSKFNHTKLDLGYGSVILLDSCIFLGDSVTVIGGDSGDAISVCFGNDDVDSTPNGVKLLDNVRILDRNEFINIYKLVSIIGAIFESSKESMDKSSDSRYLADLADLVELHIIYGEDKSLVKAGVLLEKYRNIAIRSNNERQIGISHMLRLLLDITQRGQPDINSLELWLGWIEKNKILSWDWGIWNETMEFRSLTIQQRFSLAVIQSTAEGVLTREEVEEYIGLFN